MANGLIRIHPSQTTLIDQLRHFPKADHDDGPDALHMLWMVATTGYVAAEWTPAPRRGGWSDNDDNDHDTYTKGGW
jgi:hypothetical protein